MSCFDALPKYAALPVELSGQGRPLAQTRDGKTLGWPVHQALLFCLEIRVVLVFVGAPVVSKGLSLYVQSQASSQRTQHRPATSHTTPGGHTSVCWDTTRASHHLPTRYTGPLRHSPPKRHIRNISSFL